MSVNKSTGPISTHGTTRTSHSGTSPVDPKVVDEKITLLTTIKPVPPKTVTVGKPLDDRTPPPTTSGFKPKEAVRLPAPTVPPKILAGAKALRDVQHDMNVDCDKALSGDATIDKAKLASKLMVTAEGAKSLALDIAAKALGVEKSTLEANFPNSVDLKKLSPGERQLFTELAEIHGKNKTLGEQLVNQRDGVTSATVGTTIDGVRKDFDALSHLTDERQVSSQLQDKVLKDLAPEELKAPKKFGHSFKSAVAARQLPISSMLYKFDQQLRFDTKTRILAGINAKAMDRAIKDMVDSLSLTKGEKAMVTKQMRDMVKKRLPNPNVTGSLTIGKVIGEGGVGKIMAGTFQGKSVVVKQNKHSGDHPFDVRHEMVMHDSLVDNPHAPKLLGVYTEKVGGQTSTTMVMERVNGFDLFQLMDSETTTRSYYTDPTPTDRVKIGRHLIGGAVKALKPMHDFDITHLDIKPGNIMLDTDTMESRLIDFGSAAHRDVVRDYSQLATTPAYYHGVTGVMNSPDTGKEADVYALGASLADLIVPEGPRQDDIDPGDISTFRWRSPTGTTTNPVHPDWNKPELKDVRDAIELMCSQNPKDRPTMSQLFDASEGRMPKPSGDGESGIKTRKQAELLLRIFDPNGEFGGGREILLDIVEK